MSGAEAAGLAVGVIALASLFKSCVELLEWFESGKNYHHDYKLACTKIGVLSKRLSVWGGHVQILNRGHEHPFLFNPAICGIVCDSLKSLERLLSDTKGLRRRYDLATVTYPSIGTRSRASSTKLAFWPLEIRRRTTWSIRDKAKFDRFISDVSFFMENLEKAAERMNDVYLVKGTIKDFALVRKSISGTGEVLALRQGSTHLEHQSLMDNNDESSAGAGTEGQRGDGKNASDGHVGTSADINNCPQNTADEAIGFQGTSGDAGGHAIISGSAQTNKDQSKGVQGAIGKEQFSALMSRK